MLGRRGHPLAHRGVPILLAAFLEADLRHDAHHGLSSPTWDAVLCVGWGCKPCAEVMRGTGGDLRGCRERSRGGTAETRDKSTRLFLPGALAASGSRGNQTVSSKTPMRRNFSWRSSISSASERDLSCQR